MRSVRLAQALAKRSTHSFSMQNGCSLRLSGQFVTPSMGDRSFSFGRHAMWTSAEPFLLQRRAGEGNGEIGWPRGAAWAGSCMAVLAVGGGLLLWEDREAGCLELDERVYARKSGGEEMEFVVTDDEEAEEPPAAPNGTPANNNDKAKNQVVNLEQEMLKRRKIIIFGPIDDRQAYSVCMKILYLEAEDPGKPIEMLINSPGGKVAAGLAIYDWMQLVSSPIHTVCWGRAYSMAAILLAAGEPGHRIILPNAKVMIHQPSVEIPRSVATDIMIRSKEMQETKDQLKRILAKHMNVNEAWVEKHSERDMYMKSDEAIKYGIVDRVATSVVVSKL